MLTLDRGRQHLRQCHDEAAENLGWKRQSHRPAGGVFGDKADRGAALSGLEPRKAFDVHSRTHGDAHDLLCSERLRRMAPREKLRFLLPNRKAKAHRLRYRSKKRSSCALF
jgi:hypothetical protein